MGLLTATAKPFAAMTVEHASQLVGRIDLKMVRLKLADRSEGRGWDDATLDAVERDYRRFLALNLMYPDSPIVPNDPVDVMWHAHILDTEAYMDDCDRTFGGYLHHFPYFGLRGPDDARDLEDAGELTARLYEDAFGQSASAPGAANCKRTSCKPQKCK